MTRHGPLRVYRACYYCGHCHKTLVPADTLLGLDAGCTSTQVHLWIGWLCALLPFAQAATTLEMLTSVGLSAATLERVSLALGTSLREEQQQQAQDHRHQRLPEPEGKRMRRLYIGMDDLFVPLRDPWKKDRSQGDLACRFGECKLGRDARVGVCDYTATMQSVETFEPLVATLAHQHGHHQAHEVVVLGDGAAWIGQVATRQFPGAVQIVDYYHACDHLATYAQARFGKESQSGNLWLKQRAGAETALPITLTSEAKELVRSLVTHLEGWSVGQGRLRRRLRRAMQQGVTRTAYDRRSEDALSPEAFALLESAAYEANRIYGALAAEGSPTNATWPV